MQFTGDPAGRALGQQAPQLPGVVPTSCPAVPCHPPIERQKALCPHLCMASEIQACATDPHPWGCCLRSGCFPTLFEQIQVWHTSSCTSGSLGLGASWSHPFSSGEWRTSILSLSDSSPQVHPLPRRSQNHRMASAGRNLKGHRIIGPCVTRPAGHTPLGAAHDLVGLLGCQHTLSAHVVPFIH